MQSNQFCPVQEAECAVQDAKLCRPKRKIIKNFVTRCQIFKALFQLDLRVLLLRERSGREADRMQVYKFLIICHGLIMCFVIRIGLLRARYGSVASQPINEAGLTPGAPCF